MASVRERQESAASRAAEDRMIPSGKPRQLSHAVTVNRTVRGSQEKAAFEKQEIAPVSAVNPWTEEYEREKAKAKAEHDADVASGKIRYV
jgi:hypothetical protein